MELSTLLGIIGVTISLLFGLYGIYLAFRHKYPGRIDFVREHSIALFDEIVKNLPDLSILYQNEPVNPRLVLVKGALANAGDLDISPEMVHCPITLNLPEGFQWLTANILGMSRNVEASLEVISEQDLRLNTGLLRCKEYIRFQALVEINRPNSGPTALSHKDLGTAVLEAIEFRHRIANTRRIGRLELEDPSRLRRSLNWSLGFLGVVIVVVSILGGIAAFLGPSSELVYQYAPKGKYISVKMVPHSDGSAKVTGIDSSYSESTTLKEFFSKCKGTPDAVVAKRSYLMVWLLLFTYLALPLTLVLLRVRRYRRSMKLYDALGLNESDPESG